MTRIHPLLPTVLALLSACVLELGPERRPEIRPGLYIAELDSVRVEYEFHADGSFRFAHIIHRRPIITETGEWQYSYVDPQTRFLIEKNVTRRDSSDGSWTERKGLQYKYRIEASKEDEFHLNPGGDTGGGGGGLIFFLVFFGGSGNVVFHRQ